MQFDRLTPVLWTSDIKDTIEFYKDKLGFELDNTVRTGTGVICIKMM